MIVYVTFNSYRYTTIGIAVDASKENNDEYCLQIDRNFAFGAWKLFDISF